jgi:2-dehydropantoate 2-reductase
MRVCVVGAGAVGSLIGARLAVAGYRTSALARGVTLSALRAHGWRLELDGERVSAPVTAVEDAAALGPQDLVVLAVKAPDLATVAPAVATLAGPETVVLTAMNGLPWWFLHGFGGPVADTPLESVDPGGKIAATIPTSRVVGCVVHLTCSSPEPGLVRHGSGHELILGQPDGGTGRLAGPAAALRGAGFAVTVSPRIHADIWYKLWGNMTMNPVSVLTGATCDRILDDALVSRLCAAAMDEAAEVGARIGCALGESAAERIEVTRRLGAFKTSMLRDAETGRRIELDALVGAVSELGARLRVPTPMIDALLGLTRLHARGRGLYPA